jgi:integrase
MPRSQRDGTHLAGAARLQLVSGVVQLRPEDAMVEAMFKGWRAQQTARELQEDTIAPWGRPEARPFTREELQRFLDYADEQVDRAVRTKRKGALAAYRDATLFKVVHAWGLRRTETRNWRWPTGAVIRRHRSSAGTACCTSATESSTRSATTAAQRAVGDGLGGGGGRRLRR